MVELKAIVVWRCKIILESRVDLIRSVAEDRGYHGPIITKVVMKGADL